MTTREGVLLIMFDLPAKTRSQKKNYRCFKKVIINEGYMPIQKSVYIKSLRNTAYAAAEKAKLIRSAPDAGQILAVTLTLDQFLSFSTICGSGIPFEEYCGYTLSF